MALGYAEKNSTKTERSEASTVFIKRERENYVHVNGYRGRPKREWLRHVLMAV